MNDTSRGLWNIIIFYPDQMLIEDKALQVSFFKQLFDKTSFDVMDIYTVDTSAMILKYLVAA